MTALSDPGRRTHGVDGRVALEATLTDPAGFARGRGHRRATA